MEVVEDLKKLGFSEAMALVYVELLKNPGYNGTQITKELNVPRSSVYNAIKDLLEKDLIKLIPSEENLKNYEATPPNEVFMRIKKEYTEILDTLGIKLESIYKPSKFNEVYNISGLNNIYYKINEMVKKAKKNIIFSGNIEEIFSILFSNIEIEIIRKDIYNNDNLFVIIDNKEVLAFSNSGNYAVGIYTKNEIIVNKYK